MQLNVLGTAQSLPVSQCQPGVAGAAWESSRQNFHTGKQQCICNTCSAALLKNVVFIPCVFKVCPYSLAQGPWPQHEQVELLCPSAVPLSSSGALPGILEESQVPPFGKEAVKVEKFARKLNKLKAVLRSPDEELGAAHRQ